MADRTVDGRSKSALLANFDPADLLIPLACVAVLWVSPLSGLIIIAVGILAVALERLAPFRQQRLLRTGWRTDIYHALLTRTVSQTAAVAAVAGITYATAHLVAPFVAPLRAQPGWLLGLEAFLLADLGAYGEHRLCHRVNFLWRFHSVHHMGENLDWLARYRIHPVDAAVLAVVEMIPFYVLGAPGWVTATYVFVVTFNGTWAHSNVRHSLGPLWWLIKNPELHRWHHARERRAANMNFCELLPLWDVIFHTVYMPRDREPNAYGIPGESPSDYLDQLMYPLIRRREA